MKNSVLHEFIDDLAVTAPTMPLHEQQVRRTILNHGKQQSRFAHFRNAVTGKGDGLVKHHRKLVGVVGSVAMILVLATAGTSVYSYRYSPKAVAEQVADQGIMSLSAQTPAKLAALQAKFGGDPADALKEAKKAKDLKTITKAEFIAESHNALGIFATSLGSVNGAVGTSNASGMTFMSTQIKGGPSTATVSAGTVSTSGPGVAGSTGSFTAASTAASGPTYVTATNGATPATPVPTGQMVKINADGTTTVTGTPPAEGGTSISSSATMSGSTTAGNTAYTTQAMPAGVVAMPINASTSDLSQPTTITEAAVTYLQYTDSKGHVVVLSLDKDGLPIFKTIFMTKAEAAQLR